MLSLNEVLGGLTLKILVCSYLGISLKFITSWNQFQINKIDTEQRIPNVITRLRKTNQLWIKCFVQPSVANYLCIWEEACWFSEISLSKWPPGSHIESFSFPESNFSLVLNIISKFQEHKYLCVWVDKSVVILNDVQLQSMHCPLLPLLLGGGILVDYWSTIYCFVHALGYHFES